MKPTLIMSAFALNLLASVAAFAAGEATNNAIENLPQGGEVKISGVVDKVVDADTFVLRDEAGDTIDIHVSSNLEAKAGDQVSVQGVLADEMAGVGKEITANDVDIITSADQQSSSGYDAQSTANAAVSTETAPSATAGIAASTASDTAAESDAVSPETTASSEAAASDTIATLPDEGSVALQGTVDSVSGDDSFTLRDADGSTIDVKSVSSVDVKAGDQVSVNGQIGSKMLGFGKEIDEAEVMVLGANSDTGGSSY